MSSFAKFFGGGKKGKAPTYGFKIIIRNKGYNTWLNFTNKIWLD